MGPPLFLICTMTYNELFGIEEPTPELEDDPFAPGGKSPRKSRKASDFDDLPELPPDFPIDALLRPQKKGESAFQYNAYRTRAIRLTRIQIRAEQRQKAKLEREALPKEAKGGSTRYSTDYAQKWARTQGWRILDRERYDARTKRHHDLLLGVDLLAEGPEGMIGIQAAGPSERAAHYRRFEERGGPLRAQKLSIRILYVEFERGKSAPIREEWWA